MKKWAVVIALLWANVGMAASPSWVPARLSIPGAFTRLTHVAAPGGYGTGTQLNGDGDSLAWVFTVPFDGVIDTGSFTVSVVGTGGNVQVRMVKVVGGQPRGGTLADEEDTTTVAVSSVGQKYFGFVDGDTVAAGDTLAILLHRLGGSSTDVTVAMSLGNASVFYCAMPYAISNTAIWTRDDVWPLFGIGGTDLTGATRYGAWPTGGYPLDSLVLRSIDSSGVDAVSRRFKTSFPMIVAGVEFDLQVVQNAPALYFFLTDSDTNTIANVWTDALNVTTGLDGRMVTFFDECPCTLDAATVYHLEMIPGNASDVGVLEVVVKDSTDWNAYESIGWGSDDYGSYRWVSVDANGAIQASGARTPNSLRRPVGFSLYVTGLSAGLEGGASGRRRIIQQIPMGLFREATETFAGAWDAQVDR